MKAVRGFPTHLEASLAAGIVSVRYPLLYGFPLKLGEHNTNIPVSYTHLDVYKRQGALDNLKRENVGEKDIEVAWVPGAFEIPLRCV